MDAPAIAADHGADKIGVILYIVRWGKTAGSLALGATPGRRRAETYNQFKPLRLGQVDNLVIFVPRRMVRLCAAVLKVALAVDFNILPGKLLAQPVKTGLMRHFHYLSAFGRINLLLQESVGAKRVDIDMVDIRIGLQIKWRTQLGGEEVAQPFDLGEKL